MPGSTEYLSLVGFCDPTNLVNIPSGRNHILSALPDSDGTILYPLLYAIFGPNLGILESQDTKVMAGSSEPRESTSGLLSMITQALAEEVINRTDPRNLPSGIRSGPALWCYQTRATECLWPWLCMTILNSRMV